ncbi:MAG: hypothetical protein JO325_04710 [Solirubrobacterales bacterium]|nr:hypothetical protein [Solirubrobacterales bacterium]
MTSEGSVTHCIGELKKRDPDAARRLWERYYRKLVGLARLKLRSTPRRAADEEDVALSAFDSFCRGVGRGHFPQLQDRSDLWQLLAIITARKAIDLVNHNRRQKRGGGTVSGESGLLDPGDPATSGPGLAQIIGREPPPEFAAQVADECRRLLDGLGDEGLRSVALWKMEGYTNAEIAERLGGVNMRTVERKLKTIRERWEELDGRGKGRGDE